MIHWLVLAEQELWLHCVIIFASNIELNMDVIVIFQRMLWKALALKFHSKLIILTVAFMFYSMLKHSSRFVKLLIINNSILSLSFCTFYSTGLLFVPFFHSFFGSANLLVYLKLQKIYFLILLMPKYTYVYLYVYVTIFSKHVVTFSYVCSWILDKYTCVISVHVQRSMCWIENLQVTKNIQIFIMCIFTICVWPYIIDSVVSCLAVSVKAITMF